jgi:tetratricopeptide (TPR) repeat protein
MKRVGFFLVMLLTVVSFGFAGGSNQKSGVQQSTAQQETVEKKTTSLAVFAFSGADTALGEAIASRLTRQEILRNAFDKTNLITRNTIAAMNFEQRFQEDFGLTDPDAIFELGKALDASHVIAGYLTKLGNQDLILVSIMDIESLQQIAGDYRPYRTIDEIYSLIPDIAKKLANAVQKNTGNLQGLSVPPFNILGNVNQNDAMVLAQMLSCDLANYGKYAVLPRTDSLEKVLEEHRRQRDRITDTTIDQERVKLLGKGITPQFVLSSSVEGWGSKNLFVAEILNIQDGSYKDGNEVSFTNYFQGFEVIPRLALLLTDKASATAITHYDNGETFRNKSEWALAIKEYTEAIRLNPNYALAYHNRGRAYEGNNDLDRAIADYTSAIKLNSSYAYSYQYRGELYRQKGDNDRAIADCTEAIRLEPNSANTYATRGVAYYEKKDYDRAIADLTVSIRLRPNYTFAYYFRGLAYQNKNDYDRAIADFTETIRTNSSYYWAYANRGYIYLEYKKNYDQAIADYTEAIRLNINNVNYFINRGFAYSNKGNYDQAIADYTQAIRIDPNNALAYSNRSNAYRQKEDTARADSDRAKAQELGYSVTTGKVYKIGDLGPAGGIIFYNRGFFADGWQFLEAAPAGTDRNAQWGAYRKNVPGTSTRIGSGKKNTELIVDYLRQWGESNRAAQICTNMNINGYADWFLPSKDELNLMYTNLDQNGLGGLNAKWYWSSSQYDNKGAWLQYFGNGNQFYDDSKNSTKISVRAVRAF